MKREPARVHPEGYDLAMEILATLPVEPDGARLATLARDFGFINQRAIVQALVKLQDQDYAIRIWAGGNGIGLLVCIRGRSWGMAQVAAEEYLHRVYELMDPERQVAAGAT